MTLKTCKKAVCASAVLATIAMSGGAFAEGISESFEGKTAGGTLTSSEIAGLTGNGTYAAGGAATAPAMGFPISGNHNVALEIAGTVTYAETSAPATTGASQVDLMFKVEPTDELEDPSGDDIRVALAVGTNDEGMAPIKLWCKTTSGGTADWVPLNSAVATGSWMRATLVLDYANNQCSVSLNGNPVLNDGSKWFYFANNGGTYVSEIQMVGSTMVDDLVVTHTALSSYEIPGGSTTVAASGQGSNVTYDYINKYGVTVEQATDSSYTCAGSGMTVAQKFEAGLNPTTDTKFEMQTMTTTKSEAVITFPGANATSRYSVKVKDASHNEITPATATTITQTGDGEKINTATINLTGHEDELLYFTVETVTP